MDLSVIKIGNSKGIRLSKTILEKYEIQDTVELVLEEDHIIIKPKPKTRKGWDEAFQEMHERGEDKLIMPDLFDDENPDEW
ncbi:MAG: AbrB/MazE/SpoVT family DNA-binding domain-containing protein [Bacteroidales bacterium]